MTAARPGDELRETIIGVLIGMPVVRDYHTVPITPRDAHLLADALLPLVTAYTDRRARERAAEELPAAADWLARGAAGRPSPLRTVARKLGDRADALAADDRTDGRA